MQHFFSFFSFYKKHIHLSECGIKSKAIIATIQEGVSSIQTLLEEIEIAYFDE